MVKKEYNNLLSSEKTIVDQLVHKIAVNFCRNPNEVPINPRSVIYISKFIFKELQNSCKYESEYIGLSQLILTKLMEYYPEEIMFKERVEYFIDELIYDFYNVLNN